MKKQLYIPWILVSIIFISMIVLIIYSLDAVKITKIDFENLLKKDTNNVEYFIDEYTESSRSVFIRGWIIEKNIHTKNLSYNILCKNINSGNVYAIKTFIEQRKDVTETMNSKNNYDLSGFNSKILKFLLPEDGEYKLILYLYKKQLVLRLTAF